MCIQAWRVFSGGPVPPVASRGNFGGPRLLSVMFLAKIVWTSLKKSQTTRSARNFVEARHTIWRVLWSDQLHHWVRKGYLRKEAFRYQYQVLLQFFSGQKITGTKESFCLFSRKSYGPGVPKKLQKNALQLVLVRRLSFPIPNQLKTVLVSVGLGIGNRS